MPPQVIRFGEFELDLGRYELRRSARRVRLEKQPFELLILLVTSGGQLVTRDDIIEKLWGKDVFLEVDQGINNAIRKIRLALKDDADRSRFIETVVGKGYRFIAPVVWDGRGEHAAKTLEPKENISEPAKPPKKLHALTLAAVLAALIGIAIAANVAGSRDWLRNFFHPSAPHIDSLAVLPLENLSRDPEQDYFADGMTDALITSLAKMGVTRVISRTSVMRYKGTHKTLEGIANELKVDAVVEGTILRSGDRARITAKLIHASTGMHLWAETYERDLREVLGLQSDVAGSIARQINIMLRPQGLMRPVNPQAYEAYLKGRYYFYLHTGEGFQKAVEYFSQAIQTDPTFAPAYSGLADSYLVGGGLNWGGLRVFPLEEARCRGKAAAAKAVALDDTLAEAHFSLGFAHTWYDWDWLNAEKEFRRGLELNPGNTLGHMWYGTYLSVLGRFEEGIAEEERARDLDPFSLIMNVNLARAFYWARRYDEAIAQARETLRIEPNAPPVHPERFRAAKPFSSASPYWWLERSYIHKGMVKEAIGVLQEASTPDEALAIGQMFKVSGYRGILLKNAETLKGSDALGAARCHAQLGQKDEAFELLERSCEMRDPRMAMLKADPDFDTLHSDPRFQDLLRRVGLPP